MYDYKINIQQKSPKGIDKSKLIFIAPLILGTILGLTLIKKPKVGTEIVVVEAQDQKPSKQRLDDPLETIVAVALNKKQEKTDQKASSNSLSGTDIITAGEKEILVCNDELSPFAQIYLSTNDESGIVLFVKRKVPFNPDIGQCSHFVAAINKPIDHDLEFNWWIIE